MRVYFDVCCFHRPLNDRTQDRVNKEAESFLSLIIHAQNERFEFASSTILEQEIRQNKDQDRLNRIELMLELAKHYIPISDTIKIRADELTAAGLKAFDALHMASAEAWPADVVCTCDDRFLKRARSLANPPMRVLSLQELLAEVES